MPTRNKTLRSAVLGALFALLPFASANAQDTVNLLTQNFPPFSMANDGKNFAKEVSTPRLWPLCSSVPAYPTR